jgi:hypothetical protein
MQALGVNSTAGQAATDPIYLACQREVRIIQPRMKYAGRMSKKPPMSPGKTLVESLHKQLPPNMEFDESETQIVELSEQARDRLEAVRERFAVKVKDPDISESALAALQTAIHQLEGDIFRWIKALNIGAPQGISIRHQKAVNARWARAKEAAGEDY